MKMRKGLIAMLVLVTSCFAQKESLLIGPGDVLDVQVFDTPEMEQHVQVNDAGEVKLPLIGKIAIGGLTPTAASHQIEGALVAGNFMKHPQVQILVVHYATQNVSVLGQVRSPGAYPITTPRPIVDVLTLAGGLNDTADRNITIQRHGDQGERVSYFFSNNPDDALNKNVVVYPGDSVIVPKAGLIYVLGDVLRPGGYVMDNNQSQITVLQAVAHAMGTNKTAVPSHAKLIRKSESGYVEMPLPLSDMQKGKKADFVLMPDDIIYVPFSYLKNLAVNASGIAAAAASASVYRF